jgi:hypothetical protein
MDVHGGSSVRGCGNALVDPYAFHVDALSERGSRAGVVATAPWILLIAIYFPLALHAYDTHVVAGNALMFALVVVVGSVLEGIGSTV